MQEIYQELYTMNKTITVWDPWGPPSNSLLISN